MNTTLHKVYLSTLVVLVLFTFVYLTIEGYSYYQLNTEERFYHDQHHMLKPSGVWGHGMGIVGSFFMLAGVSIYMTRKRIRWFSRLGHLKHWLEFHIFLCSLGPLLVLFHTAFKFGGLVAVSFWSMVAVVISGLIGRYIYLQIPRTIEGRVLSLSELDEKKSKLNSQLVEKYNLDELVISEILDVVKRRPDRSGGNMLVRFVSKYKFERKVQRQIKAQLMNQHMTRGIYKELLRFIRFEIRLNRKIDRLVNMQKLFRYWHVVHLPFALIMLVIMIVHVIVALAFGYKWIF